MSIDYLIYHQKQPADWYKYSAGCLSVLFWRKNMRHTLLATAVIGALVVTGCSKPAADQAGATNEQATTEQTTVTNENAYTITGAGASFPQPVYAKWATDFNAATGNQVNYQSIGSSGGIKQIVAKTVDFGASDAPMKPEELEKEGLIQFPTVIGGVVPVVNIDGVEPGALKLDGETLANIYLGKITTWDDPAIKALNPDLALDGGKITTIFRSDGSGTTFNFTNYLNDVSADWQANVGVDKTVNWPTAKGNSAAGKGNEGVASYVNRMKNSIGYVEYAYAKQNKMSHVALKNKAGNYVQPSQETFAAAGDADWQAAPGFYLLITNQGADQAWPISAATFILVHKQPEDPAKVKNALEFFDWAYTSGNDGALGLDYVPFSDATKALIRDSWKQVVDKDGKPVY